MLIRVWHLAWPLVASAFAFTFVGCGNVREPRSDTKGNFARMPAIASNTGIFGPSSVFNQPLSSQAPVDPSSPTLVARLVEEVNDEQQSQAGPWIETTSYSSPIYKVPRNQPSVRVKLENNKSWAKTLSAALAAVPMPANARPAAGSDAQITIWQPSTDRLWELWRASKRRDGWHAVWGGAIDHVSKSHGYYTASSWPGAHSYWGATATSLPIAAGMMTIPELKEGRVDHALAIDLPTTRAGAYAWPSQRTDGEDPRPSTIPEGARLRIDPRLNIKSLNLPPMTEAMALAAQRYGMIVRDQTHHAIGFYAEDPTPTGKNPYPALMGYETPAELLSSFPWRSVEVLQMSLSYGTGRPSH